MYGNVKTLKTVFKTSLLKVVKLLKDMLILKKYIYNNNNVYLQFVLMFLKSIRLVMELVFFDHAMNTS